MSWRWNTAGLSVAETIGASPRHNTARARLPVAALITFILTSHVVPVTPQGFSAITMGLIARAMPTSWTRPWMVLSFDHGVLISAASGCTMAAGAEFASEVQHL